MPHKHKRKRDDDTAHFDLDPTVKAKPLPAYKPASVFSTESSNKRRKGNAGKSSSKVQDDTPKAFARMMAWQAAGRRPSGFDDGSSVRKPKSNGKAKTTSGESFKSNVKTRAQSKADAASTLTVTHPSAGHNAPQILPGESLSQFSVRVDQSMPLSTLPKTSANNPNIPSDIKPQARVTKHNKRLQRMISDWRSTDEKLKEKREEEDNDFEDKREEEDLLWDGVKTANLNRKGKKKNKNKGTVDDDPWKDLEKTRREATKQKNLQDVVQAPPSLIKVKSKFKVKDEDLARLDGKQQFAMDEVGVDVQNVPNAVGSLRKREEMGRKRKEVIEGYRKLQGKRLKGKGLAHPLPRSIVT